MRFFLKYLKSRFKYYILFFIFILIFAVIFSLYNLPVEAVLYAFALSFIVSIIFMLFRFYRVYRTDKILKEMQKQVIVNSDELPSPQSILERDYSDLVSTLYHEKIKSESEQVIKYNEMMDYYTLWAHQIKTPIAAMRLLLQSEEPAQNSELLEQLFKIEQYVEMVLQYLRTESLSSDLAVEHQPLDNIVKQAVRKYAKTFIRKKIKLEYSNLNCEVLTDEKWLVFVIEQLLSNALKYTSQGMISIYMDKENRKTLVIEDTGIGIQAEDLPRVCEKGFTGYNGRTDKKSTGIGLYLCKRILNRLSHTLTIESEVGKGTKVKIGLDTVDITIE